MSATSEKIDFYDNLNRAAGFDVNNIYPSLFQLLGYRKHIAEQLLRNREGENTKDLEELYNYTNDQIKLLLGL